MTRGAARWCGIALATIVAAAPWRAAEAQPPSATFAYASELPSSFKLVRLRVAYDGVVRFDEKTAIVAPLPTGNHAVEVIADYKLDDSVFTYMRGISVELRSSHIAHVRAGRPVALVARAVERGNATTPLDKRARIVWSEGH